MKNWGSNVLIDECAPLVCLYIREGSVILWKIHLVIRSMKK